MKTIEGLSIDLQEDLGKGLQQFLGSAINEHTSFQMKEYIMFVVRKYLLETRIEFKVDMTASPEELSQGIYKFSISK